MRIVLMGLTLCLTACASDTDSDPIEAFSSTVKSNCYPACFGTGLVFMLRWFWWRINAWSEIVAMLASLVFFTLLSRSDTQNFLFGDVTLKSEEIMAMVAGLTIATWLLATFLTPPESDSVLASFYRKIRPGGPGWKPVARQNPDVDVDKNLGISIVGALFAAGIVYATIPATGYLIFGQFTQAIICLVIAGVCALVVTVILRRIF